MAADQPLLHVMQYAPDRFEEWSPHSLEEVRGRIDSGSVTWINVESTEDAATLRALERDFGVHPLTIEDVRNTRQRPKVEEYSDYLYVVAQMVRRDEQGDLLTEQVSVLMGVGWVITVQDKPGDVFDGVRARIRQPGRRIRRLGPDYLVYALLDAIVDAYFPLLEGISAASEAIEEAIIEGDGEDVRARLQGLRRELLTLRRVAWPQRDAVQQLERGDSRWITRDTRTFLRDVTDHATRVIDFVEVDRELAASLMDLHLANLTQRTNEVMKVLTLVATIFIPLTFVAGVYGMNFRYMPELEWPWAYPTVLAFMATLGIWMYVSFRRRGWV